jgi:hypothetical protein
LASGLENIARPRAERDIGIASASISFRGRWTERNEPLSRGRGKPHIMELAYGTGGEVVYVNRQHPQGITEARFRRLPEQRRQRYASQSHAMVRDSELFAKGAVRHPDHATIVLREWHRVLMNTEHQAAAMQHVAFLD